MDPASHVIQTTARSYWSPSADGGEDDHNQKESRTDHDGLAKDLPDSSTDKSPTASTISPTRSGNPLSQFLGFFSNWEWLLVAAAFLAYLPALAGKFVWDDDSWTSNIIALLRDFHGLGSMWLKPTALQQYYPLAGTTFWIDYRLWGFHPVGYHLENVLLHAFSAVLLWRILQRLRVRGAWLGAAIFALHPVCVESVAWITERKNVLSGVFFLGSVLASIKFWLLPDPGAEERDKSSGASLGLWRFYWLALALYLCALLSKTATVGLPGVIFLLLWWKRGRLGWRDICLLLPFLAVGVAMGLTTMWLEKHHLGAGGKEWGFSAPERLVVAGRVFWFYLGKLFWPHPLMFVYPRWTIQATQPMAYLPVVAAAAGVLLLWRKRHGWGRPVLFAVGYFVAILFPVMGFFDVFFFRYSFVCDHFQYLACIGPLVLAAAGITTALGLFQKRTPWLAPAVCGTLLLMLGMLTWRQTGVYRNFETLWRDSLAKNPKASLARIDLGVYLASKGRYDEAMEQYRMAVEANPNDYAAQHNLGIELARRGKIDEAIEHYRKALQIRPNFDQGRYSLANALSNEGKFDEAIQLYTEVLKVKPDYAPAHYNLGAAFIAKRRYADAIVELRKALQIQPNHPGVLMNLGNALVLNGQLDEAVAAYRKAVGIDPSVPGLHMNLGVALLRHGKRAEAQDQFAEALRLKPDFAEAQQQLRALDSSQQGPGPIK